MNIYRYHVCRLPGIACMCDVRICDLYDISGGDTDTG